MIIFDKQNIFKMHLHISLHDVPIGLAPVGFPVVNSIRLKRFHLRKNLNMYEQVYT